MPVTVNYATADGTATVADNDYVPTSGTLTFLPGTTSQVVTVLVNGDTINEADETFSLNLTNATNTSSPTASATGTIVNDDPVPVMSIGGVSLAEGNSGTTPFVFTVSLSAATEQHVTVAFTTADGTATTADNDYVPTSGTLTSAGATSEQITVLVNGDTNVEPNENFTVQLSDPTVVTLLTAAGQGLGTILNDDGPHITFAQQQVSNPEGNSGTTPFVFTVNTNVPDTNPVTVVFSTADGTATTADNDYQPTSGTLTFAAGATSQNITVLVNGDTKNEADETFTVNLSDPEQQCHARGRPAPPARSSTTMPSRPSRSAPSRKRKATRAPRRSSSPPRSRPPAASRSRSVYTTSDGTATTGRQRLPGHQRHAHLRPRHDRQLITVLVNGDTKVEADETFDVTLSAASAVNATMPTDVTAVGTIQNDDFPSLSIGNVSQNEGNSGTTAFIFTATLSTAGFQTMTVAYTTADGTATVADGDYQATSGTLTFAAGVTSQLITVLVNGDTKNEADETFTVNLSSPVDVTLTDASATGTIVNDDAVPGLSIGNVSQNEGNLGTSNFVFTVSLAAVSGQTVTVAYGTSDGTATVADNDYLATSGTLTFAPGTTTEEITVAVVGDTKIEPDETFLVNLSNPTNATLTTSQGTGTIVNDDVNSSSVLSGIAFIDVNNSKSKDSGEQPLPGVTVTLVGTVAADSSHVSEQTTTGNDGSYSFTSLQPGTYDIIFSQPSKYLPGHVSAGSEGGTIDSGDIGITATIPTPGGIDATDNDFFVPGLLASQVSYRQFLASSNTTPATLVSVAINSVTSPVNSTNQTNTTASGTGTAGATISLVATDGSTTTSPLTTTVSSAGNWSISGVDIFALNDGTITYKATATVSGTTANSTRTTTKDTAAPAIAISTVTNPLNSANSGAATISGTGEAGALVSVTATDGTSTVGPLLTQVTSTGTWSITGFNVSSLKDGTITFSATATDTAGNTAKTSTTANKDTVAPAPTLDSFTNPINSMNDTAATAGGTGEAGDTVKLVASNGSTTTSTTATVGTGGTWQVNGFDLSSLPDGTITYAATETDGAGNTTTVTKTASKDIVPPAVSITSVTNPIVDGTSDTNATVQGTTEPSATVKVVASEGFDDSPSGHRDGRGRRLVDGLGHRRQQLARRDDHLHRHGHRRCRQHGAEHDAIDEVARCPEPGGRQRRRHVERGRSGWLNRTIGSTTKPEWGLSRFSAVFGGKWDCRGLVRSQNSRSCTRCPRSRLGSADPSCGTRTTGTCPRQPAAGTDSDRCACRSDRPGRTTFVSPRIV